MASYVAMYSAYFCWFSPDMVIRSRDVDFHGYTPVCTRPPTSAGCQSSAREQGQPSAQGTPPIFPPSLKRSAETDYGCTDKGDHIPRRNSHSGPRMFGAAPPVKTLSRS